MIKKDSVVLIAVLFLGILLLYPSLDFQPLLATGDHGRDLYAFQQVSQGAAPYRDFWWQYGPFMPYYYAALFTFFGTTVQTALFGKALIIFLAGLFFYLAARNYISLAMAVIASCWFWVFYPDFFYTYCHDGGVLFLVFVLFCLAQYQKTSKQNYIFYGLAGVLLLNFVRVNLGLTCLLSFIAGIYLTDRYHKRVPTVLSTRAVRLGILSMIFLTILVYFYLIKDLSPSALRQCFPYLTTHRYDGSNPITAIIAFITLIARSLFVNWATFLFGTTLLLCVVRSIRLLTDKQGDKRDRGKSLLIIYSLLIFLGLNIHEFLLSFFYFRIFWVFPFFLLLFFVIFEKGLMGIQKSIKVGAIVIFVAIGVYGAFINKFQAINVYKVKSNFFEYGQNRLYIANSFYWRQLAGKMPRYGTAHAWIKTVRDATDYLNKHVADDKAMLVIPYDPFYYFLSGKTSPVYHLAFFDYIRISAQDEAVMISQLEEQDVDYVVLSSRAYDKRDGTLGNFGQRYCPMLANYIFANFEEVAVFGEWERPAGFAWNHSVKILKRKK